MPHSFRKVFSSIFFPLVLILVWIILVWKNYTPATWLTGWDNLHPEFDFKLNISRSLSVVWQEYQGLGLVGGMAHAADLPRQIILWVASIVIPVSLVRYFWTFLMLLVGHLGAYFLVGILIKEENNFSKRSAAFLGAFFYLLNLATVQYFYVPYESFISFYGFLPWLLFFALKYLKEGTKQRLLSYLIISILATSSFYVQTLFIVYMIFLGIIAFEVILQKRKTGLFRSIKLFIATFAVNVFWLLPVVYFSITNPQVPGLSKINSIATPETQIMNQTRGSLPDIALLKGYWFDYYDFRTNGKYDYLFANWINHTQKPEVLYLGVSLFITSLVGLVFSLFGKKSHIRFSFSILFFVSYLMLATSNPPFGFVYQFLSKKIPLFAEIFRNVFTKWSVPMALIYSIGIGNFALLVIKIFKGRLTFLRFLVFCCLVTAIFWVVKPNFEGKLIYSQAKSQIPNEYFQLFNFLQKEDQTGRIVYLPVYTFWGWDYYNWGYGGSGFLWYGIKQPILARAFDVWSSGNEGFYNEISFALYSGNNQAFENTLQKYQVKYLLLDESIINAGGSRELLKVSEIKNILLSSNHVREAARLGFLTLYETDFNIGNKFISVPTSYSSINANLAYSQIDQIYSKYGDYIINESGTSFPFANFDKRGPVSISQNLNEIVFENKKTGLKAVLPVKDATIEKFNTNQGYKEGYNCDLNKNGTVVKSHIGNGILYKAESGGVSCDYFYYPDLKYDQGYVLRVKGENKSGRGLKIYLQNLSNNHMDLEELLPTGKFDEFFVVLPAHNVFSIADAGGPKPNLPDGNGYNLNVETRSFGRISSENIVDTIEFIPAPTGWLMNFSPNPDVQSIINNLKITSFDKFGTAFYRITTSGSGLIELGQGYDSGWLALQLPIINYQFSVLNHVKVDSWANGWIVKCQMSNVKCQIVIVYWPQILEYIGFLIGISVLGVLILTKDKSIDRI